MADSFLEELEEPTSGEGGSEPAAEPQAASAPAEPEGTTSPPDGGGTATPEPEATPQHPETVSLEDYTKAKEEAAYYRGLAEAGRVPSANQPEEEISEEEERRRAEAFVADPHGVTARLVNDAVAEVRADLTMQQSVTTMKAEAKDYDEVYQQVVQAAKADPAWGKWLDGQLATHPDPARFVYQHGKQLAAQTATPEDRTALEERIRKEVEAETEARLRKKYAIEDAADTPPTPADANGSGGTAPADSQANEADPLEGNAFD